MLQRSKPTESTMVGFFSDMSYNITAGGEYGGSLTFNGNGAAFGAGVTTPQVSAGAGFSILIGKLPISW
jgi:hypothetical protein